MKTFDLVVLGLSLSSSWGNGHATTYRALLRAYAKRGKTILFLERDQPWYAAHRDLPDPDFCTLALYDRVEDLGLYVAQIAHAEAVVVGSYVPDGIAVARHVQETAHGVTAFYDIDTPVTLAKLAQGTCEYLSPQVIPGFDLYLSFTGGPTLDLIARRYGAKAPRALYCAVDAERYRPLDVTQRYDLGYLGTYAEDRQPALQRLLLEPARAAPHRLFVVAGPQYPAGIDWPKNVTRIDHVPPVEHPAFYSACRFALNLTRADMVEAGFSPSVRLFEAAACGTPIISDVWRGIEELFVPGREIALARTSADILAHLAMPQSDARAMGRRARNRVLGAHTAAHRAAELAQLLSAARLARATASPRTALTG